MYLRIYSLANILNHSSLYLSVLFMLGIKDTVLMLLSKPLQSFPPNSVMATLLSQR